MGKQPPIAEICLILKKYEASLYCFEQSNYQLKFNMINQIENSDLATTRANQVLLVTSAISTAITVGWILWYCRVGFDFTDNKCVTQ
jgi:hypothetical protein